MELQTVTHCATSTRIVYAVTTRDRSSVVCKLENIAGSEKQLQRCERAVAIMQHFAVESHLCGVRDSRVSEDKTLSV